MKKIPCHRYVAALSMLLMLTSCSAVGVTDMVGQEPQLQEYTTVSNILRRLPPPQKPIALAVYRFDDKTGQNKPSDDFPEYSRAVTQGGASILAKALYDAGNGSWFNVLEREGLSNLAQERKIIRATREEYRGPDGRGLGDIGPLKYAGVLVECGIVAYESDTITGGFGARYLGVGGDTQYRRDVVTVALRAISVKTGEVVLAVNTSKTIFLTAIDGNLFRFTSIDELLQIESGVTVNEPPQFAVRQAIELAVYSMIMEGAERGLWSFANPSVGQRLIANYVQKRDGDDSVIEDVEDALKAQHHPTKNVTPTSPISNLQPPAAQKQQEAEVSANKPARQVPVPPVTTAAPVNVKAPSVGELPPAPDTTNSARIQQLPKASTLVRPSTPTSTESSSAAREEFRRKVKEALKRDDSESLPISNGINSDATSGQVMYCGPSGCVPAYGGAAGR